MKIKASTWYDPKTKEKKVGGTVELYETESKHTILDGINIDLGATTGMEILFGVSKDFEIEGKEFSIGGYVDVLDTGKQLYNKMFKKSKDKMNVNVKIGLSKTF